LLKRIAITGPESTGKSELAEKLAKHYNALWVPEYAREYLEDLGHPYKEDDIVNIAKGQLEMEEEEAQHSKYLLFCDTDFIVTKIWSEFKYGRCHPWILEQVEKHIYDLYLLCDIDLPWAEDPLREHPQKRKELFELYYRELKTRKLPFRIIAGTGEARTRNAILAVEETLNIHT
jgi:NadR type nicotinamide-nucleotide adenylyltransferase